MSLRCRLETSSGNPSDDAEIRSRAHHLSEEEHGTPGMWVIQAERTALDPYPLLWEPAKRGKFVGRSTVACERGRRTWPPSAAIDPRLTSGFPESFDSPELSVFGANEELIRGCGGREDQRQRAK